MRTAMGAVLLLYGLACYAQESALSKAPIDMTIVAESRHGTKSRCISGK